MQTAERTTARAGKIWRLLVGDGEDPLAEDALESGPAPEPARRTAAIQDLSAIRIHHAAPSPQAAEMAEPDELFDDEARALNQRMARLENGVRLLAEALKRVHLDLRDAVGELREDLSRCATSAEVEAMTAEAVAPVQQSMERLAESTQSLPLILGSATERLVSRIESVRVSLEENVIALMARSWDAPVSNGHAGQADR